MGERMREQASPLDKGHESSAAAGVAPAAKPRLLVIDDEKLHRMIICRAGAKAGYAPAGAATYEEAVKLVQEAAFDCITLDLSLGPHAGVELLYHLRGIGWTAPIIVISGCDSVTCAETVKLAKSLNLNVWQTIPKPVDLSVLHYWLERRKTEREAAAVAA
jgi:two-component system, chemotaxis family, chemotaxis protein CheY